MKKREQINPVHTDSHHSTGGGSALQPIAGPTATNTSLLLHALSRQSQPVKICVVVDRGDLEWLDLVKSRTGLSKSEIVRRAVKALKAGQIVQSDLRGRQD